MTAIKAVLGGLCIFVGATVYMSCDNKIVGAFLFAIGLFAILSRGYKLFTGSIGYFWERKMSFKLECLIILLGNFAGAWIGGLLIRLTRWYPDLYEKANIISNTKLQDDPLSILVLSMLCGMLMYIAVHGWNTAKNAVQQAIACFVPVAVFILAGFEHCIANMCYFWIAGDPFIDGSGYPYLLLMIVGNAAGAWLLSIPEHMWQKPEDVK